MVVQQAVTVVIPVFNAAFELDACLASLARHTPAHANVLIIDDASTDAAIQPVLQRWRSTHGRQWRFLANSQNLGFVATANRGMRMATGHIVLLNSDTLVTAGWLDRLLSCLGSDPAIGTATPWSNNGEITSIPRFCEANPVPGNLAAVASDLRSAGAPQYPEIPTAVGFCMAISTTALHQTGLFNEQVFGRGYGEENDLSLRMIQAGFRNVLCDDAYVAHRGGRSFGPEGLTPGPESMQRLLSLHPSYLETIQAFIEADPLAKRRAEVLSVLQNPASALG